MNNATECVFSESFKTRFHAFVWILIFIRLFSMPCNQLELVKTPHLRFRIGFHELLWIAWTMVTDGVKCEIVNAICIPWYPVCPYPSKEEFTAVSVQLVQKYPILRLHWKWLCMFNVCVCVCVCEFCIAYHSLISWLLDGWRSRPRAP